LPPVIVKPRLWRGTIAKNLRATIPDIKINEAELRIDFPNGARIRLFGAETADSLRGLYFDAVVLDEPADFPMNAWSSVIRPAISDRQGKATFIGTPKGKNLFWDVYDAATTGLDLVFCDA
jgi:phage terminase large subunit